MDIPSFLQRYPPFDELAPERLEEVVRHTRIEFFPAGTVILRQSGEPAQFAYVVRTGSVDVIDGTQIVDVLGEGELFGHFSLLSGLGPAFAIRADEDAICYLVDPEIVHDVLGTRHGLAFLSTSLRKREVRALDGIDPESVDPWQTPVGSLVHRPPVSAPDTVSIREAAELMTRERVSSLLVEGSDGVGIVTDRDLRSRVLAEGRSPEASIAEVLTKPVITVGAETMVAEVTGLMLERGVHHVPVVSDGGDIVGVVTDIDLMGVEQKTPFVLKGDIERAKGMEEAIEAARRLPETVSSLVEANVDPIDVGHAVAVVIDTLTRRLLEIGIGRLGDPPCSWSWLALGSEARQEQGLLTDQDNALVLDPGASPIEVVSPYFERLATLVNDGLSEAGIPKCRAGVIASNPEWRDTLLEWQMRFRRWIADPGRSGSAFTGIAFDYRPVAGPLEVRAALDDVIRTAAKDAGFIRHLGRWAVSARPPTGFQKDSVVEARGTSAVVLDVKHGGIALITNLARVWSIARGLVENRTLHRLRAVEAVGGISGDVRQGLEEAFRLLWQIRLEHQTRQANARLPVDDQVNPRDLGPLTRQGLKEAFRMIDRAQDLQAREFGLRR